MPVNDHPHFGFSRSVLLVSLLGTALGASSCRSLQAQRPDINTSDVETTQRGAMLWSATQRLSWSDYRAQPSLGGGEAAVTASSLLWGFECTDGDMEVQVASAFFPDRSWVSPDLLVAGDNVLLQHERTHFDLTEIFARRMRRFFSSIESPCDHTDDELTSLGSQFVREESDAQRRYDLETSNGRDPEAQARWDLYVTQLIGSLARFARPDIPGQRPAFWRQIDKR